MKKTGFGTTGLEVAPLSVGIGNGPLDRLGSRQARTLIQHAIESGVNLFDTSNLYRNGHAERLLGSILNNANEHAYVATKGGQTFREHSPAESFLRRAALPLRNYLKRPQKRPQPITSEPAQQNQPTVNQQVRPPSQFDRAYLESCIRLSLKRLQTNQLDFYQLHGPPPDIVNNPDIWKTLNDAKESGWIKHWGISCLSADDANYFVNVQGCDFIQLPVNAGQGHEIEEILRKLRDSGLGIIGRQPFGQRKLLDHPTLRAMYPSTPMRANRLLRYALFGCDIDTALAGISTVANLDANVTAANEGPLAVEEVKEIAAAVNQL